MLLEVGMVHLEKETDAPMDKTQRAVGGEAVSTYQAAAGKETQVL